MEEKRIDELKGTCWESAFKGVHSSWIDLFQLPSVKPHLLKCLSTLHGNNTVPPIPNIFEAFKFFPVSELRLIILGQDPYPTVGYAHGLSFSSKGAQKNLFIS